MIKFRQSGYGFMAWNMARSKAQVGCADFQQGQAAKAAYRAVVANSGMGALYLPGTDRALAGRRKRLKSEFFQQQDEVKKLATSFNPGRQQTRQGRADRRQGCVQAQFGKTGETCKACHDKFGRTEAVAASRGKKPGNPQIKSRGSGFRFQPVVRCGRAARRRYRRRPSVAPNR